MYVCINHFFVFAIYEHIVKQREKWDLPHLSRLRIQVCGQFVEVVWCCWAVDFFVKDSSQILRYSPNEFDLTHILEWLVSEPFSLLS